MTPVLLVAGLAGAAAWLAVPPAVRRPTRPLPPAPAVDGHDDERPRRWLWSGLAGLGAWGFVSGWPGLAVGLVVGAVVWVVLGRAETPAQRRRRERLRADLPHVVGLLAAAVRSGLPPSDGLAVVCDALPGPAADVLAALPPRIDLGSGARGGLGIARIRARPGAARPHARPLGPDRRARRRGPGAAGPRARRPLPRGGGGRGPPGRRPGGRPAGLCLLPAFLLVGVVPVVAGLVGALGG